MITPQSLYPNVIIDNVRNPGSNLSVKRGGEDVQELRILEVEFGQGLASMFKYADINSSFLIIF